LLNAVDAAVPEVADITRLGRVAFDNDDPFRNLEVSIYYGEDDTAERDRAASLKAQAEVLTAGCPYHKVTTVTETDFGMPSQSTNVITTYTLDRNSGRRACENQALIDKIVEAGINQIVVETADRSYGDTFELTFGQGSNTWRDMAYIKKQLEKIEEIALLVAELQVLDTSGYLMIGRSRDITLVESTGNADFTDVVTLQYWLGWGDCPAGCIAGHTWTIKVTPLAVEGGYQFQIEVLAEDGDPLPTNPQD